MARVDPWEVGSKPVVPAEASTYVVVDESTNKPNDTHRHLKLLGLPMALCWREVDPGHSAIQVCVGRLQSDLDLCERERAERQRQESINAMVRVAKVHAREGQGGPRRV